MSNLLRNRNEKSSTKMVVSTLIIDMNPIANGVFLVPLVQLYEYNYFRFGNLTSHLVTWVIMQEHVGLEAGSIGLYGVLTDE